MTRKLALSLILLVPVRGASNPEWQDAKVVDVGSESFTTSGGSQTTGRVDSYGNIHSTTTNATWGHERWTYTIDTGKYLVTATEILSWRWSKPARVIVGDNIEYFMKKRDVYIRDLDGKEHKLSLIKQVLKADPLPLIGGAPAQPVSAASVVPPAASTPPTSASAPAAAALAPTDGLFQITFISTPPNAMVSIGGMPIGRTPFTTKLPSGVYKTIFSIAGYENLSQQVTVAPGYPASANAKFKASRTQ